MEESGPDSGGWGPAEEPLFTVETALEQVHFSTVFVALLGGWGMGEVQGFLGGWAAYQGRMEPSPVSASSRKHMFSFHRSCQAVCAGWAAPRLRMSFLHQLHPSYVTLLAAGNPGALRRSQPRLADFQPSGTVLGPGWQQCQWTHCTLVTGQPGWQPQRLGAKEGLHCLLEGCACSDLGELLWVSRIVFGLRSETCRKRSPSGEQV